MRNSRGQTPRNGCFSAGAEIGEANPPRRNGMKGYWVEGMAKEISRAAIGAAAWRSRPRRRAVDRAMSDFLSEYWLQYIAFEIPDTTEELFFALCEANSRLQLLCCERNGTHEISDLKEPVFVWSYILRELPFVAVSCRHGFVDEICDDSLATIVIHFNLEVSNRREPRLIEFVYGFLYVLLLIVGDKRYNVEARSIVGNRKIAGLVNEYAQSRVFVHPYKARAAGYPPLKAKNFLRVSVTPAFRLSSLGIVPNLHAVRKGADFVTNDFEENSERMRRGQAPRNADFSGHLRSQPHRDARCWSAK